MHVLPSHDMVHLAQLRDAPSNANVFDPARFEQLREGIAKRGFLQPILVRKKDGNSALEIVDGHHRVRAVCELNAAAPTGWQPLLALPAVVVSCTDAEAMMLAISMNRLRGELDLADVSRAFCELMEGGASLFELAETGFSTEEVDTLVQAAQDAAEDIKPESMDAAPEEQPEDAKAFVIEIEFADKVEYQKARRGLKRAAGKGGELSAGLMKLLGEEEEEAA